MDLPEAFLLHTEGDVDLVVILVDFIEKWLNARKHCSLIVDAASRIPDLRSEKVVRLITECPTTIDESCAYLRELQNTIFESVKKADPQMQHVRGVLRRTMGELCQVFEVGTFSLDVASAFLETCFDLGRDIRGSIRCIGDVCCDAPELVQILRNGLRRVEVVLL